MATETMVNTEIAEAAGTAQWSAASGPERLPTTVQKPSPYSYDLGHLAAIDPNPLPSTSILLSQSLPDRNATLRAIARDGAQTLLNTFLTTCSITSTSDGLVMALPPTTQQLPRWKPLPKPKQPTKWELFARKKGIGKYGGSGKGGAALEERRKNMVYDEEKGEWVKRWGYKGKNKDEENDWLVELDDKTIKRESEGLGGEGQSVRGEGRRERKERIKRQDRRQRNNERRNRKGGTID